MTLATHIVIAAAVAKPLVAAHPLFPFLAAVASHYLADAIPHWDYTLHSVPGESTASEKRWAFTRRSFFTDFARVASDGLIGTALVASALRPTSVPEFSVFALIVIGGVFPDLLEGVYYTGRAPFLKPFHRFHEFIHTKIELGTYPLIGIPLQILIALIAMYFLL